MNVNSFYKELFEDILGLDVMGLEYMYRDLISLINRKTLPLFSNMIPCAYYYLINLDNDANKIESDHNHPGVEYYIRDTNLESLNIPILGILGYTIPGADTSYQMSVPSGSYNMMDILQGSENMTAASLLQSGLRYKKSYELIGENVARLTFFPNQGVVELKLKIMHPTIASITEDNREILMTLAKYDVKIKLYNELKYLEDVVTPLGNLNLKISDWDSADRDRDDYIKELRRMSFPDRVMAGSNFIVF